jgi:hypothetical protein
MFARDSQPVFLSRLDLDTRVRRGTRCLRAACGAIALLALSVVSAHAQTTPTPVAVSEVTCTNPGSLPSSPTAEDYAARNSYQTCLAALNLQAYASAANVHDERSFSLMYEGRRTEGLIAGSVLAVALVVPLAAISVIQTRRTRL